MSTKTETPPAAKPETKCNVNKAKKGDVWSRHSFGRVVEASGLYPTLRIENTDGKVWDIGADLVSAEFSFADQFDVDVVLARTKVLEILMKRTWTAMTVKFRKKVESKDVAEALGHFLGAEEGKNDAKVFRKAVDAAMAGEERIMLGYHHGDLDPHGRLIFAEIVDGKEQRRLIDPRTVFEVIVAQTRYVVDE